MNHFMFDGNTYVDVRSDRDIRVHLLGAGGTYSADLGDETVTLLISLHDNNVVVNRYNIDKRAVIGENYKHAIIALYPKYVYDREQELAQKVRDIRERVRKMFFPPVESKYDDDQKMDTC